MTCKITHHIAFLSDAIAICQFGIGTIKLDVMNVPQKYQIKDESWS
jgi:hypothetical protein